jgi:hypothetical protein
MPNVVRVRTIHWGEDFDLSGFLYEFGISVADLTLVLLMAPNALLSAIRSGSPEQVRHVLKVGINFSLRNEKILLFIFLSGTYYVSS